ncbi:hypothetical protein AXG93_1175s1070 [Marchantia polymorpha subsp. ruderalis]|uniref:Uncharacterized protein n=1 Tax=Marchantia polymorpha subsp. ruderalis TaxID=1480154 RepID=A0A176VMC7_MARPO|nr:hypothetical protein AXG93_1175s1070 [Marchantia polymorpha subsp. ruderalis]
MSLSGPDSCPAEAFKLCSALNLHKSGLSTVSGVELMPTSEFQTVMGMSSIPESAHVHRVNFCPSFSDHYSSATAFDRMNDEQTKLRSLPFHEARACHSISLPRVILCEFAARPIAMAPWAGSATTTKYRLPDADAAEHVHQGNKPCGVGRVEFAFVPRDEDFLIVLAIHLILLITDILLWA